MEELAWDLPKPRKRVIILEEFRFDYTTEEIALFRKLWGLGWPMREIIKRFRNSNRIEFMCLMLHCLEQGLIEPRVDMIFFEGSSFEKPQYRIKRVT